ncbi:MAG: tyrosine--tRNA ligase [Candidatus Raymondbacteria bacterium RifOxyA12_full_50_37]|uniref:Tyrosine--tRNA ligase n=1 Tax=Candidatus Raymondbacteria bacterium RIFOXYD12_FULL_49_13 TaxID=1817890 RepID=A0A1F7FKV8_UNCRA|nr:MAG: tyrosine--tRNA ligase [Candidatus Raymondbacteria bacterium RifOxyA12_full_50_37]OGJ88217.1 MAG: tyrosine--tRNA ligase [Candidatus Raymondbacteria bacterium RIFOXYA2_FULL_49_16]OGJ95004.1 MAG: tyrosine--tRNA ligase [Candidatus Raymondbacteria bacterium RifOxyB12_full_50_8]OGK07263.1 MAG: tyrosine--tRNA ligase [Candidatus Raymondbacteria bacterium RIFOXYD12_FULL_49_13]OGP41031.1 MAG: tyrosine--tRNA ligase [Candidatus Raymondbacteria bacterium RIFOXYB2_FULL_49_35]
MKTAFETLHARGYIAQLTHEDEIKRILRDEKIVFYAGFDPTANSLHAGHLLPVMVMSHMQRAGHTPIILVGGGTAMVGDPTGKDDMRQMLPIEAIDTNAAGIKKQLERFLDFTGANKAIMVNNAEWIRPLNYVDFLRSVGRHFSVNRMLTAECFKQRLQKGLSFLEFNYMLLQAYDFLHLNRTRNCTFQIGGDDQWSNILAGIDLVRREEKKETYGITAQLIETSSGKKMGKTEKGAVWLDAERTSPFEYYQYWRNTHDADVMKFINFFTFITDETIVLLNAEKESAINEVKKTLAFEATKIVHGEKAAVQARDASAALFEQGGQANAAAIPTTDVALTEKMTVLDLFLASGLILSKSEGRKLIEQGGLSINDSVITSPILAATKDLADSQGIIVLRKGKKTYHRVRVA